MIKCEICDKDFKNINSLRSHKSQQHKQVNPLVNHTLNTLKNKEFKHLLVDLAVVVVGVIIGTYLWGFVSAKLPTA